MSKEGREEDAEVWVALRCESLLDTVGIALKMYQSAKEEAAAECQMVLAIAYYHLGSELWTKKCAEHLCSEAPTASPLRLGAALIALLAQERFAGVPLSSEQRNVVRTLFAGMNRARPEYAPLASIVFRSELGCGAADAALAIAQSKGARIDYFDYVDAHFAAHKVADLNANLHKIMQNLEGDGAAMCKMAMGYAWLKLRNPKQALVLLALGFRLHYGLYLEKKRPLNKRGYQLLQQCYQMLAEERYVTGTPADRFRLCEKCETVIDRQPLLAQGTDFLVCGYCFNVAFCSAACSDAHWPKHEEHCGKSHLPVKRIDLFAPDKCEQCLCAGAQLQCTQCKAVRYCDEACQKAHWKRHKKACMKK